MIRSVVAVRHVDPPPSGEPHPAAPGPVVARWTRRSTQTPLRTAIQHGRLTAGTLLSPSGILTEQGNTWFYKSNLGHGEFTPAEVVAPKPSFTGLAKAALQLQDL